MLTWNIRGISTGISNLPSSFRSTPQRFSTQVWVKSNDGFNETTHMFPLWLHLLTQSHIICNCESILQGFCREVKKLCWNEGHKCHFNFKCIFYWLQFILLHNLNENVFVVQNMFNCRFCWNFVRILHTRFWSKDVFLCIQFT